MKSVILTAITEERALREVKIMNQLISYEKNGVFKIVPKDGEHFWAAIACSGIARDLANKHTCNGGYLQRGEKCLKLNLP